MRRASIRVLVVFAGGLAAAAVGAADGDTPKKAPAAVVVTDVDGKETRLTNARLTTGTRRLGWLADPKGTTQDEKLGPQAIEVREPNSTTFAKGVITLIPAASLESAKYDYEKLSADFSVKGVKDPVQGTLQYRNINTIGITGTVDGKAASFTAGAIGKAAIKSVVFPDSKPLPGQKEGGATWAVQITHPSANNPTVKARNLRILYQFVGGVEKLADGIPVRKGETIPFDAMLTRFEMLANDTNTNFAAAEIEIGKTEKVVAIPLTTEENGRTGTLAGLIGEVEAGYKLFPLHTIKVIVPLSRKAD